MYKEIYQIGNRLPKRDKLGLHGVIEKICIKLLVLSIKASLRRVSIEKQESVIKLRIKTETLKYLIRVESELKIIQEKPYLLLEEKLQEISKEVTGWEKYLNKNSPLGELL
ncbi:MAG: four helix bundle protein [Patescibacteria group bacterium]